MKLKQLHKIIIFISFSVLILIGCQKQEDRKITSASRKVGGDRDVHGCIGSAGFQWCAKENKCVRSWELAKDKNFENSQIRFRQYCN